MESGAIENNKEKPVLKKSKIKMIFWIIFAVITTLMLILLAFTFSTWNMDKHSSANQSTMWTMIESFVVVGTIFISIYSLEKTKSDNSLKTYRESLRELSENIDSYLYEVKESFVPFKIKFENYINSLNPDALPDVNELKKEIESLTNELRWSSQYVLLNNQKAKIYTNTYIGIKDEKEFAKVSGDITIAAYVKIIEYSLSSLKQMSIDSTDMGEKIVKAKNSRSTNLDLFDIYRRPPLNIDSDIVDKYIGILKKYNLLQFVPNN